MSLQKIRNSIPINLRCHYSYDTNYNCLGYYVQFSCYIDNHYISKTYKKRIIDNNFNANLFVYQCSKKWCQYIKTYINIINKINGGFNL